MNRLGLSHRAESTRQQRDERLCLHVSWCESPAILMSVRVPTGSMTLTRGSFSYSSGEEYHGEWKEGKTHLHPSPVTRHPSPVTGQYSSYRIRAAIY